MPQKLVLIRGLPGSGKSTLARTFDAEHLEADMYFIDRYGDYQFNPMQIKSAHQWCEQQVERLLELGFNVVVSNTFVQYWEMKPYVEMAKRLGIELEIICCKNEFTSVHDIDPQTIKKMQNKWQACEWLKQAHYKC